MTYKLGDTILVKVPPGFKIDGLACAWNEVAIALTPELLQFARSRKEANDPQGHSG